MYADQITDSMQQAIAETDRRRTIQDAYNRTHGITPQSVQKKVVSIFDALKEGERRPTDRIAETPAAYGNPEEIEQTIRHLEDEMMAAARDMAFEHAAELRDRIYALKARLVFDGTTAKTGLGG
jgi:excinuclease ABC subunit B